MEITTNKTTGKRALTPSTAGNYLTNGAGVFSQKVFLGDGASADAWSEITEAEKTALEEAQAQTVADDTDFDSTIASNKS